MVKPVNVKRAFVKILKFVQLSKTVHKIITVLKYQMINTVTALVVNIAVHLIVYTVLPKFQIVNEIDDFKGVRIHRMRQCVSIHGKRQDQVRGMLLPTAFPIVKV